MNEASTASDIVKKVTVLDAILWLTTAWDSVSPETIQKCFRKCGFLDAIVDASSDDEWDEEDLRPLLPPGTSLRDYINSDDHVATQRTIDDNWERALLDDANVATDGEVDSSSEEGGEKVVSSTTAWSHSSDLLNYALSTNNSELIALLSQARDLIQSDCRKAIDSRRQVSITDIFANQ